MLPLPRPSSQKFATRGRRLTLAAGVLLATTATGAVFVDSPAEATTPGGAVYVAFGDSYSAGPGLNPTRTTETPCQAGNYPSQVNWPSDVASTHGITSFRDFSCSGATVVNTGTASSPSPLSLAAEIQKATVASNPALGDATKDVTVMISGNDVWWGKSPYGSVSKAGAACLTNANYYGVPDCSTAQAAQPSQWLQPSDISSTGLFQYLLPELTKIHAAAPAARILLVGYPTVVKAGDACTDTVNYPSVWDVKATESTYADSLFSALDTAESNFMIAPSTRTALGNNAYFVALRPATVTHGVCAGSAHWIEPIKITTTTTYPFFALAPDSGHPNPTGMSGMANSVWPWIV